MYKNNDIYVNGKYYNTNEVLQLNDNMEFKLIKLNSYYSVLYMDNYYANPDLIRELGLNIPATKHLNMGFPGFRSKLEINIKYNIKYINDVIRYYFKIPEEIKMDETIFDQGLMFNIGKSSKEWHWHIDEEFQPQCQPHIDGYSMWASLCYLNKDDEHSGNNGTGIYRSKFTDSISHYAGTFEHREFMKIYDGFGNHNFSNEKDLLWGGETLLAETKERNCNDWLKDEDDNWKLEHLIEMKYNRMVIYPGNLFHSIYWGNRNDFKNNIRITQPGFVVYKGASYGNG
tara:strand:- start:690 stop:1547 length:858 start_codon:yes stop_codon:yes gene_type:complete